MTKNADSDKYSYSGHDLGFDAPGSFSLLDVSGFGRSVIMFGADMSSSVHVDNNKKNILILDTLILGKGPTDGFNATTLTAEKNIPYFTEQQKTFCLTFKRLVGSI